MKLHVLPAGPIQTNAYLLVRPDRQEAILVDAPGGVWPAVSSRLAEDGVTLREVWLTHGHWDHMQGAAEVLRHAGPVRVLAHPADREMFEHPEIMSRFMGEDLGLEPVRIDHWLQPVERHTALGLPVEIRHVPGHCPGNVLFYFPDLQAAFVGDAIFAGSVGRTDLPGGSMDELERSIREQIFTLPPTTRLYPGHGPATTVEVERRSNPFVRAN